MMIYLYRGDMAISKESPWLFLLFQLPTQRASERVAIWRKLQRFGAIHWKGSSWVLPHTQANDERFHWLLEEILKSGGDGSVLRVAGLEEGHDRELREMFNQARTQDYAEIAQALRELLARAGQTETSIAGPLGRLRKRLQQVEQLDLFSCPAKQEVEALMKEVEHNSNQAKIQGESHVTRSGYNGRQWLTRPRPEIDRVASAWLIQHHIDPQARFVFSSDPDAWPEAIRFDVFNRSRIQAAPSPELRTVFTHEGDACTFEVLLHAFSLRDRTLQVLAEIVHDADLEDNKFGRSEGIALQQVLVGWNAMELPDAEILRRGFELFDALYATLKSRA